MRLRIESGRDAGREVPVAGRVLLGRSEECELRVLDEAASRRHAEVVLEEGRAVLRDLESTNGVRLNGCPTKRAELTDGDVIRIGAVDISCLLSSEAERATVMAPVRPDAASASAAATPERPQVSREERLSRLSVAGPELVGESPAFLAAIERARIAAGSRSPVLVTGPTGTGKELVARLVHRSGPRPDGPFVPVNCAAIAPGLIESELFGHEAGAFTGAARRRAGCFELADGGTLFLDEVGDLPAEAQAKLLRAIESGEFYRVGGSRPVKAEARTVAATNRDLEAAVAEGRFRADLFYRLNVLRIELPALAERKGDVRLLARYYLNRKGAEMNKTGLEFAPEALAALEAYPWPGNVRELANVVERALVLSDGPVIGPADLPADVAAAPAAAAAEPVGRPMTLAEAERRAVVAALQHTGWKKGEAAKLLDISWPTLNKKIADYGIAPPDAL